MLNALNNVLTTVRTSLSGNSFSLEDIPGFPVDEYTKNLTRYKEKLSWYLGDALDVETVLSASTSGKPGKKIELYPVRINPITGACLKHASALFGEVQFDARPIVPPRVVPDPDNDKEKKLATFATTRLNHLWWENMGRSMMMENGILSQIMGGCVFKISHTAWDTWRVAGRLRIERTSPAHFVGIPSDGDPWRLSEAWFVYPVTPINARRYGVNVDEGEEAWYIEHWTKDYYTIQINGRNIVYNNSMIADYVPGGQNPYGFVPSVYIPHIRAGSFYGQDLIENLEGIVKERNLRMADAGDKVSADTHDYAVFKNTNSTPPLVDLAANLKGFNLGKQPQMSGNDREPDMEMLTRNSGSQGAVELSDNLHAEFRRAAFLPAVADGEDEGSQRSAATLLARMWPLISHTTMERIFWDDGLNWINTMALKMLNTHGYAGITKDHLGMRIRNEWYPPVPKDRQQLVDELVNRAASNIGSLEHLMQMTGDIEDPADELQKIIEWQDMQAERMAKFAVNTTTNEQGDQKDKKSQSGEPKKPSRPARRKEE